MDDYYLTPVDIIPKLPKNFDELLASKKWQERKDALDMLGTILTENPKLEENAAYRQIVEKLNKILAADLNINCAAQSAKCLTQFTKGLRAKFAPFCPLLMPTVFDKFKEKKAILREPLVDLVDSLYSSSNLLSLAPAIMGAFGKKPNPSQKAQIDQFVCRIFRSPISPKCPKELLRDLITSLSEHACDPDPDVRDSAFAALGAIQMCVGEKALSALLNGAVTGDATKMAKIAEYKEKAELEAAALAKSSLDAQSARQSDGTDNNNDGQQQQNGDGQLAGTDGQIDPWDLLDPVDIVPKMPSNFDELMASKKWQERKEALDGLATILTDNPRLEENAAYRQIVEKLNKILATDLNINCAAQSAKCLAQFAKALRAKFAPFCPLLAPTVFDKFKEKKAILREPLVDLVDSLYSSSNLPSLAPAILEAFGKKPNPSQKAQIDQFICRIFRSPISPKEECPKGLLPDMVTKLSEHACDPDPDVRDSAFAALGAIQMCVGEKALSALLSGAVTGDATKMAKIGEYREKAAGNEAGGQIVRYQLPPSTQSNGGNRTPSTTRPRTAAGEKAKMVVAAESNKGGRPESGRLANGTTSGGGGGLTGQRPHQGRRILSAPQGGKGSQSVGPENRQNGSNSNNTLIGNNGGGNTTAPAKCRPATAQLQSSKDHVPQQQFDSSHPMGSTSNNVFRFDYANTPSGSRIPRLLGSRNGAAGTSKFSASK